MKYNTFIFSLVLCLFSLTVNAETTHKTGHFQYQSNLSELMGAQSDNTAFNVFDPKEKLEWELYVPSNYSPDVKPGLLVYISPTSSGKIPEKWQSLMDKYNLIWIAANKSGNKINSHKRMTKAVLATSVASKNHDIDASRIYVVGFSGGGRMASLAASQFPQLFKGAIYNSGVNYWQKTTKKALKQMKSNRYVFISGKKDFNLKDTKTVFKKYKKAGFDNIKLIINQFMGHSNPNKKDFEDALKFLEDINPQG